MGMIASLQLGGWNQKCVGDRSRGWSLTRSLEAWSICLTPTSSLWRCFGDMVPKLTDFENNNTEFEISCFLLTSQPVFHFWYLFLRVYMCPCAHMHILHPTQYDLFSESSFFWLNVSILCTFNNILQLCQKLMPCLLMHNFEKSFHFE